MVSNAEETTLARAAADHRSSYAGRRAARGPRQRWPSTGAPAVQPPRDDRARDWSAVANADAQRDRRVRFRSQGSAPHRDHGRREPGAARDRDGHRQLRRLQAVTARIRHGDRLVLIRRRRIIQSDLRTGHDGSRVKRALVLDALLRDRRIDLDTIVPRFQGRLASTIETPWSSPPAGTSATAQRSAEDQSWRFA